MLFRSQTITIACVSGAFSQMVIDPFSRVEGRTYKIEIKTINAAGTGSWRLSNTAGTVIFQFSNSSTTFVGYSSTFDRGNLYLQRAVASGNYSLDIEYIKITPFPTAENTTTEFIMGSSTTQTAGAWLRSLMYNRAITAADALQRIKSGVPLADRVAPNKDVTISNFDFSDGSTGWTTATVVDGELVLTVGGNQQSGFSIGTVPANGRVAVRMKIRSTGGNVIPLVALTTGAYDENRRNIYEPASQSYPSGSVIEFTTTNTNLARSRLWVREQGGVSGRTIFVDEIQIRSIGITADYRAENAQSATGQVFDSANNQHGVLPATGASLSQIKLMPEFRSTQTWANTSEIQYITLFNQSVLPLNHYIEMLVCIPEGDTLTGFTIGDGSNAAYYATVNGPITSGVPIYVALDKRVHDGTNRKLTITPRGSFNGKINITGAGRLLERN